MAYDPKKKRPKPKSLDSVVDEIFGEEVPEEKAPAKAKKPTAPKAKAKSNVTSIDNKAKAKTTPKKAQANSASKPAKKVEKVEENGENEDVIDNVLPLHPQEQETPLVMQPQVWVATGIAALIVLLIARKRKKK